MADKKLHSIPQKEWVVLSIGVIIFAISEALLVIEGYTDLLLNAIISFVFASLINFVVFRVQNKIHRLVSLIQRTIAGLVILIKSIPQYVLWILEFVGIAFVNLVTIPVIAIYFTIYGIVLSLSGGTSETILQHYDAFGHRMIAPIEKYLHLDIIVNLIVIGFIAVITMLILLSFQSAVSVTSANAANAAYDNGVTGLSEIWTYLPVLGLAVFIVIIIFVLRAFMTGAAAFA